DHLSVQACSFTIDRSIAEQGGIERACTGHLDCLLNGSASAARYNLCRLRSVGSAAWPKDGVALRVASDRREIGPPQVRFDEHDRTHDNPPGRSGGEEVADCRSDFV